MIPLIYQGAGHWRAEGYHARRCDKAFGLGEEVMFELIEDRSPNSHRHYFARIRELWKTLPEWLATDFPDPNSLRKRALIDAGYFTQMKLACKSEQEAIERMTFLQDIEEYLLCSIEPIYGGDWVLTVRRAISQSMRLMKKKRFEQSKNDVLDTIERLIRREPPELPFGQNKEA